jgi:peptidoglycan/xylan/chitin deacetylase (PgdA/CDA1 family)
MRLKIEVARAFSALHAAVVPATSIDGFRILMYHALGSQVPEDRFGLYSISPSSFLNHIQQLTSTQVCSLVKATENSSGVAISFDDGFRDVLTVAAPILESANIPFTAFITQGFSQSGDRRYLSTVEIQRLAEFSCATIGVHGKTHRRLTECADAELAEELYGSRSWMEDILGREVICMSYPHGAVNQRVRAAVEAAGYCHAACSRFGAANYSSDRLLLPRVDVWATDRGIDINRKLCGHWDWLMR